MSATSLVGAVHRLEHGPITTTQLVMYAGASGDFNRIHFDQPYALKSGLDGVLAHGMLTMGVAATCALEAAGPDASVKKIEARFVAPVKVGDTISVTGTVMAQSDGDLEVEIEARVGGAIVLRGAALVALPATVN